VSAAASSEAALERPFPYVALVLLVCCQVSLQSCLTGMRMAAPLQVLAQDYGPGLVGLMLAMFAVAPIFFAIHAGRMADRHGYHRPACIAALLCCSGAALASLNQSLPVICLGAALCGAGSSCGLIALQRAAGRLARSTSERMKVFGWVAVAPAVASLVGPLGAGLIIDRHGFASAFAVLAALPLATLLLTQWVPTIDSGEVSSASGRPRPAWDLLRDRDFRRLLFINWLVSASWDVHSFAVPILGHARGLSASAIGAVLGSYAVTSTLVRLALIPWLAGRFSQRRIIVAMLILTALLYAAYPLFGSAWSMGLGTAVLGIALDAIQPALMTQIHQITPSHRLGEGLALRSMCIHASATTMPLLFGVVGVAVGASALFWLMGGVLLGGAWQARRVVNPDGLDNDTNERRKRSCND